MSEVWLRGAGVGNVQKSRWASGNAGKCGICMYVWCICVIIIFYRCKHVARRMRRVLQHTPQSDSSPVSGMIQLPPADLPTTTGYSHTCRVSCCSDQWKGFCKNICTQQKYLLRPKTRPASISQSRASGALTSVSLCRGPGGASVQTRHISRQFLRDNFDSELYVHLQKFVVVRLLSKWQQKL